MKKILFALAILLIAVGCSGIQSPVEPVNDMPISRTAEFWGDTMPDGWHGDGTLMSHDDICYYFAAHLTMEWFHGDTGHPYFCNLFNLLRTYMLDNYAVAYQLVRWYERNLHDIPDSLDIVAPCE